jgi:hypothetical protein
MNDATYSFVYDRAEAAQVFQEIGIQGLLLAILARIPAQNEWEGCLVYSGEAPEDDGRMICVGMRGPGAMQVQEQIVEHFENTGIPVPAIYEGGPEPRLELARVKDGKWSTP